MAVHDRERSIERKLLFAGEKLVLRPGSRDVSGGWTHAAVSSATALSRKRVLQVVFDADYAALATCAPGEAPSYRPTRIAHSVPSDATRSCAGRDSKRSASSPAKTADSSPTNCARDRARSPRSTKPCRAIAGAPMIGAATTSLIRVIRPSDEMIRAADPAAEFPRYSLIRERRDSATPATSSHHLSRPGQALQRRGGGPRARSGSPDR